MGVLINIFVIIGVCIVSSWTQSIFRKSDLDVHTFKGRCDSSNGPNVLQNKLNYFRYLVPSEQDPDILYIGAMNYIFKVYRESMNCSASFYEEPSSETLRRCRIQGKKVDSDCQNHIRVILERGDMLDICGTGGYSPMNFKLDRNLVKNSSTSNGVARCPFDPFDNYTAIQVSEGNPGDSIVPYYATYTDFVKNSPAIFREQYVGDSNGETYGTKITDREDTNWLNAPQFVGSFDDPMSVKFFFREVAMEGNNKMYARVAKVCKYDFGGGMAPHIKTLWSSFQKARLICSLPGDSPYHFNDIYDVFERDDLYYALFYKQGANLNASAICIYDKQAINNAFEGPFQARNEHGVWEEVVANPRLDNCTALKNNPGAFATQISQYQLMYRSVQPMFGRPVYYINGVQLLKIAVSKPAYSGTGEVKDVSRNIYAASDTGEIYDIFMKNFSSQQPVSFITELNSIYRPFSTEPNASYAVWNMKFLKDDSLLGFGTDVAVANLNLNKLCSQTTKLNTCIRNIRCQWNNNNDSCIDRNDQNLQDTIDYSDIDTSGVMNLIQKKVATDTLSFSFTEGVYANLPLSTKVYCSDVTWVLTKQNNARKDCLVGENCLELPNKFAITTNGDLVIMNVTSEDRGTYTACPVGFKDIGLIQYEIQTAKEDDQIVRVWKQQFNDWSSEFKRWKQCSKTYFDSCSAEP